MHDSITITREQLYELVWQKPMSRLATEFTISNVGLAKVCARHDIPRPPRGYWAKLAAGKTPPRPDLPAPKNAQAIRLPTRRPDPENDQAIDLEQAIADAKRADNRIVVLSRLRNPSELVREAKLALAAAGVDRVGLLEPPADCLSVRVSRAQLGRALRIADALLRAFAKREWDVAMRDGRTDVLVRDAWIAIAVEEQVESVKLPPKPNLGPGRYSFHYHQGETVRRPSGRLCVSLEEQPRLWNYTQQRRWRGTEKRAVEDRLDGVVVGMLKLANAANLEAERKAREARAEEARRRKLQQALDEQLQLRAGVAEEQKRVAQLQDLAGRWQKCQHIRSFVEQARANGRLPELGIEGEAMEGWVAWAQRQADRLDPLLPSPPSILDDAERIEQEIARLKGRRR